MDDLFGLIVIIIGIAAGIYSDKKKKEGKQKKAAVPNQPGGGRKNVPQTQVSYGGHAGRPDVLADAANAMQRDLSVRQQELKQSCSRSMARLHRIRQSPRRQRALFQIPEKVLF